MLFKQFARFETNLLLLSISNNLSDFYILQKMPYTYINGETWQILWKAMCACSGRWYYPSKQVLIYL